jgi:stage II sporulation protein D
MSIRGANRRSNLFLNSSHMKSNTLSYSLLILSLIFIISGCIPQPQPEIESESPPARVLLNTLTSNEVISFTGLYYLVAEEAQYEFGEKNRNLVVEPIPDGLRIYNNYRNLLYRNHFPIVLKPADPNHHFIYKGKEYAGEIHFIPGKNGNIHIINRLSLEEYLKGVVPAEIFATKPQHFQAIKAQAICARTYALKKIKENAGKPYDLHASVADQAYAGYERHTGLADQAVQETKGTILTYNNKPAQIYYHSTCGGKLEAAHNLFSDSSMAYMQVANDAAGDVFSCSASPYFRWIENRSIEELDSTFFANYGKSLLQEPPQDTIDANFEIKVTGRSTGGRANAITISYADTLVELKDYDIRRFFAKSPKRYLPSTLFYLTQESDSSISILGAGNGHGVGLCQYGAINMSIRDFQFYHILGKYFPGTELLRIY